MTTCPKCGHVRQPGDASPDYECPACGVIYEKYAQHMASKAAREAEEQRARLAAKREADRADAEAAKRHSQEQAAATLAKEAREVQEAARQAAERVIACPDCKGTISRKAPSCPHCGSPFLTAPLSVDAAVVDVRMPFMSMVVFMVKWAIASIPAAIILIVIGMLAFMLLGGMVANGLR